MNEDTVKKIVFGLIKKLNEQKDYSPHCYILEDGKKKYVLQLYFDNGWKWHVIPVDGIIKV